MDVRVEECRQRHVLQTNRKEVTNNFSGLRNSFVLTFYRYVRINVLLLPVSEILTVSLK